MSNLKESVKSWKTTIVGFVPLVLSLLIMLGIIDPAHQSAITEGVSNVLDNAESSVNSVLAVLSAAVGLIGLFSKDGDK